MKKLGIILAGAVMFDLGVVVVASHAASDVAKGHVKLPPASQAQPTEYLKVQLNTVQDGHKIGTVKNADACKSAGGEIQVLTWSWGVSQHVCKLPGKGGPVR